jgi:hypothetical protein
MSWRPLRRKGCRRILEEDRARQVVHWRTRLVWALDSMLRQQLNVTQLVSLAEVAGLLSVSSETVRRALIGNGVAGRRRGASSSKQASLDRNATAI